VGDGALFIALQLVHA